MNTYTYKIFDTNPNESDSAWPLGNLRARTSDNAVGRVVRTARGQARANGYARGTQLWYTVWDASHAVVSDGSFSV